VPTEYGRNGTGLSPKKQRDTVEEATPYRRKSDDISAKKQPSNGAQPSEFLFFLQNSTSRRQIHDAGNIFRAAPQVLKKHEVY